MSAQQLDTAVERLNIINANIARASQRLESGKPAKLIAVSKTFGAEDIIPVLKAGHRLFGENRVQEAQAKWPALKEQFPDIQLHLIGPLQSNKAKDAVALFDVIQTIDRAKIATALADEMKKQNRDIACFVQVNIGAEEQKAGIEIVETIEFVNWCRNDVGLNIRGLMCIPPAELPAGAFFAQMNILARQAKVEELSMGMSADYETAVLMGADYVRVGSALFGTR